MYLWSCILALFPSLFLRVINFLVTNFLRRSDLVHAAMYSTDKSMSMPTQDMCSCDTLTGNQPCPRCCFRKRQLWVERGQWNVHRDCDRQVSASGWDVLGAGKGPARRLAWRNPIKNKDEGRGGDTSPDRSPKKNDSAILVSQSSHYLSSILFSFFFFYVYFSVIFARLLRG